MHFNNLYWNKSILPLCTTGDDQISASLRKKKSKEPPYVVNELGRIAYLFNNHFPKHNWDGTSKRIYSEQSGCLPSSHCLKSSILIGLLHFGILPSVHISQAKITPTHKALSHITSANRIVLTKPWGYRNVRALHQLTKPHKNSCDLINHIVK